MPWPLRRASGRVQRAAAGSLWLPVQLDDPGGIRQLWICAVPCRNGICVGGKGNQAGSQEGRKRRSAEGACGASAGSRGHTGSRETGAVRQPDFAGGALCGPADQPSRRRGAAFGKRRRLLPPDTGTARQQPCLCGVRWLGARNTYLVTSYVFSGLLYEDGRPLPGNSSVEVKPGSLFLEGQTGQVLFQAG